MYSLTSLVHIDFPFLDYCGISFYFNLSLATCIKMREIYFQQWKLLVSIDVQERQIIYFSPCDNLT